MPREMSSVGRSSLRDICLAILAQTAERFLDCQWSDGRFASVPEHETDEWNFFDQQYVLPAALLYVTDHPASPWRTRSGLWEAILRNGRHIASRVGEDGSMRWRLGGVALPGSFVCQRLTCAFLLAYQMLKRVLPEEEEERWRATILRACDWLFEHKVAPFRSVERFTSHHVQTGTNHFSLYLSLLWLAGTEFGRPDWVELASDLMPRLIADQRPGGYWEEHHGPALGYNYLTYHGVEQYHAWSGHRAALPALRVGMDLHRHWTYPDGIPIECIDGRMRHLGQPMLWGLSGFSHWTEGRGYARLLLERAAADADRLSGESLARIAEAYLGLRHGDEVAAPQQTPRYCATLDGVSAVRKEGPWVVALSGQCSSPWPENQFCLDRQALLSVWHERAGLVLDGSNSKFQPELATFCQGTGKEADHLPLEAALLSRDGDEEVLEAHYRGFVATVRVRVPGADQVELGFRATAGSGVPVTLTLVPNVSLGETFTLASGTPVNLTEEAFALSPAQHQGSISFRNLTVRLPEGCSIEYPVSPFNSYSSDNTSAPSANRLVVRCPVGPEWVIVRLTL